MNHFQRSDLYWILPLSLGLGMALASVQPGSWEGGWAGFSILLFLCLSLLTFSTRWAAGGKMLYWMVALAFILRFAGGVTTFLSLPVVGYVDDEDQSAGFTYTDAHRRDTQAWELAASDLPIVDAFSRKYAYDQYGGLLAFSAFIYRTLSPDAHRPLMLVLLSGFMSALALTFLYKAAAKEWGTSLALAAGWIYALYPESLLLGGSAMREPYLWAFSGFALWGFVEWKQAADRVNVRSVTWLGLGLGGMLLVSPMAALATLVILAGWVYFSRENARLPWWSVAAVIVVFLAGLFLLSSALNRNGTLGGGTPVGIINNFMREAVKWDVYQLERGSGWVQKLFDEMPEWMRLPFVTVYGIFQPVLPAAFVEPTVPIWRVILVLRALGWYAMLPALILSVMAAASQAEAGRRRAFLWLAFMAWTWIIITALRGGGDSWDNPRYRSILLVWQVILAGNVWVWWRETRSPWAARIVGMELVFLVFFGQWYANRYLHFGSQLPFFVMVALILGSWGLILGWGLLTARRK